MSEPTVEQAQASSRPGAWFRRARRGGVWVFIAVATVYWVRAFDSRSMLDLQPWHEFAPPSEYRAVAHEEVVTLADYLKVESRVFEELEAGLVTSAPAPGGLSRYEPGGRADPRTQRPNWNRTYELEPEELRGGALLVHGLTDSPYSLRALGAQLRDEGYYVLGLRLPAHGTTPAALLDAEWEDWQAAVHLGFRHVRERIGPEREMLAVGYSTGGTLIVNESLAALNSETDARADRLCLISPAFGITPFAFFADWHYLASWAPYFEKFRWESIELEYDPYKYVSFPKNGGQQSRELTVELAGKLERLADRDELGDFPPTLCFQSLVDSTVIVRDCLEGFFGHLPEGGHELVLFDVNRAASLRPFFASTETRLVNECRDDLDRGYRLTLITNRGTSTPAIAELSHEPGSAQPNARDLGVDWPPGIYSLSHIALPIPPDDPIYGLDSVGTWLNLGSMQPRGERGLLRIPITNLMRLRSNPFFEYVEARVREFLH